MRSGFTDRHKTCTVGWPTLVLLNMIDQSISDTKLVAAQLEEEVTAIFAGVSEKEKFKIRQILKGFDDISKSFERITIHAWFCIKLSDSDKLDAVVSLVSFTVDL